MGEKSMCFIGVEKVLNIRDWDIAIEEELLSLIYNHNVRTFYFSARCTLASECYHYICKVINKFINIKTILVLNYGESIDKYMIRDLFYDVIIAPNVESESTKICIDKSDYVLCFYTKNCEGYRKVDDRVLELMEYAKSKGKLVINVALKTPDPIRFNYNLDFYNLRNKNLNS